MMLFLNQLVAALRVLGSIWQRFDLDIEETESDNYGRKDIDIPPFVTTTLGRYEGYIMKALNGRDIYAFEGVPFAEPPERFKNPVPKRPFEGTFDAKNHGKDCLQTYYFTVINAPIPLPIFGSEDCLTCSIYSTQIPDDNGTFPDLPVILNFYGGSFAVGSSNEYGPAYLLEKDLVLVSCSYRIGVFGFLSTASEAASGNWGLKDASLALDFVHTHIRNFGGDPQRITVFGQSAGAAIAHLVLMTEEAKGKAYTGMVLSGTALSWFAVEDPSFMKRMTWRLAIMCWCPTNQGDEVMVECIRKQSALKLAILQDVVHLTEGVFLQFHPVVEPKVPGAILTDTPENLYKKNKVPNIPMIISETGSDADLGRMIFDGLKLNFPLIIKVGSGIFPLLLDIRGKVIPKGSEEAVAKRVLDFYGGIDAMVDNPRIFIKLANDRIYKWGMWKAIKAHGKIARTHVLSYTYKTNRGIASRFFLNPEDYDTPHTEDIGLLFNRTDVEPMTHSHPDYQVLDLYRNILLNWVSQAKFLYTLKNGTEVEVTQPVNPDQSEEFEIFEIGDEEGKVIKSTFDTNVTRFWDSLGIKHFISL